MWSASREFAPMCPWLRDRCSPGQRSGQCLFAPGQESPPSSPFSGTFLGTGPVAWSKSSARAGVVDPAIRSKQPACEGAVCGAGQPQSLLCVSPGRPPPWPGSLKAECVHSAPSPGSRQQGPESGSKRPGWASPWGSQSCPQEHRQQAQSPTQEDVGEPGLCAKASRVDPAGSVQSCFCGTTAPAWS